jgi:hypothetical protein
MSTRKKGARILTLPNRDQHELGHPGVAARQGLGAVRRKGQRGPYSLFLQEVHLHSLHLQEPAQAQGPSAKREVRAILIPARRAAC